MSDRVHVRVPFMYVDASNYKANGWVDVSAPGGDLARENLLDKINDNLHMGDQFIPQDVGLDGLQAQLSEWNGGGLTDDDHCWHEIDTGYAEMTGGRVTDDMMRLEDLAKNFEKANQAHWPSELIPIDQLTGMDFKEEADDVDESIEGYRPAAAATQEQPREEDGKFGHKFQAQSAAMFPEGSGGDLASQIAVARKKVEAVRGLLDPRVDPWQDDETRSVTKSELAAAENELERLESLDPKNPFIDDEDDSDE